MIFKRKSPDPIALEREKLSDIKWELRSLMYNCSAQEALLRLFDDRWSKNPILAENIDTVIRLLVKKGADVNKRDKFGANPLSRACSHEKHSHKLITALLENGADPTDGNDSEMPLWNALKNDNISFETLKALLDKSKDANKAYKAIVQNKENNLVVADHLEEITQLLVEKGAQITNECVHSELYKIFKNDQPDLELIKSLLEKGADPTIGGVFCSSLKAALENKTTTFETIKALLDNCKNLTDALKIILENNIRNTNVNKQLIIDSIKYLIIDKKVNLNMGLDNDETTPLHFICRENPINLELLKLLLENGEKPELKSRSLIWNERTLKWDNRTSLHYALVNKANNFKAISLLIDAFIEPTEALRIIFSNESGFYYNHIQILLKKGADQNINDWKKETLLHRCCDAKNIDIDTIHLLLEKKADINAKNKYDKTPLVLLLENTKHSLSCFELAALIDTFIENGVDAKETFKYCKDNSWKNDAPLALMYYFGIGTEKNYKAAFYHANYAYNYRYKNHRNPYLLSLLGCMYLYGLGTRKNYKKAYGFFNQLANQDESPCSVSQYNLAHMYRTGKRVAKNHQTAFEWYLKAFNNGALYLIDYKSEIKEMADDEIFLNFLFTQDNNNELRIFNLTTDMPSIAKIKWYFDFAEALSFKLRNKKLNGQQRIAVTQRLILLYGKVVKSCDKIDINNFEYYLRAHDKLLILKAVLDPHPLHNEKQRHVDAIQNTIKIISNTPTLELSEETKEIVERYQDHVSFYTLKLAEKLKDIDGSQREAYIVTAIQDTEKNSYDLRLCYFNSLGEPSEEWLENKGLKRPCVVKNTADRLFCFDLYENGRPQQRIELETKTDIQEWPTLESQEKIITVSSAENQDMFELIKSNKGHTKNDKLKDVLLEVSDLYLDGTVISVDKLKGIDYLFQAEKLGSKEAVRILEKEFYPKLKDYEPLFSQLSDDKRNEYFAHIRCYCQADNSQQLRCKQFFLDYLKKHPKDSVALFHWAFVNKNLFNSLFTHSIDYWSLKKSAEISSDIFKKLYNKNTDIDAKQKSYIDKKFCGVLIIDNLVKRKIIPNLLTKDNDPKKQKEQQYRIKKNENYRTEWRNRVEINPAKCNAGSFSKTVPVKSLASMCEEYQDRLVTALNT